MGKAITVCWAIVAVSIAWFTWETYRMVVAMGYQDIPAWQHSLAGYVLATLTAFGVALLTAFAKQRWAGIVLIIASLALGAVPIVVGLMLAACHGCGDSGPGTLVIFLVYIPIAVFSFVTGKQYASGRGDEAVQRER